MFNLKKHYFDGIDKQGNVAILYFAELKLVRFKILYSSYILSDNDFVKEKSTLSYSQIGKNNSSISNAKLKISGNWNSTGNSLSEVLFQKNQSKIKWNCVIPKADFSLEINGKHFYGLGYSEILEMNFVPWKLPISTLKWGRFLSKNHTIIWIEWIGKKPLKKVYWNGNLIENAEISDAGIKFHHEKAELVFDNPISLKDEKLLKIAEKYPFLKLFFSHKFLQSREMKFKSKTVLISEEKQEIGYSLYETVLWEI